MTSSPPSPGQRKDSGSTSPGQQTRPTPLHLATTGHLQLRDNLREGRRPSIQFVSHPRDKSIPTGSPKAYTKDRSLSRRRISSPPPPSTFEARVSFDTFDNPNASDLSFTITRKHKGYEFTKRSRTFMCGTDENDYSEFALEWLIDELVDDGDEIVCLRVVDKDSKYAATALEQGRYRGEAERMLASIESKNKDDKKINLILEFSVGKVQDIFQHMMHIYEPQMLVVGTRGRSLSGFQGLLPGSVSKWCLQHSQIPVVVVRPSRKREKKKEKRRADPSRRGYLDILDRSGKDGLPKHMLGLALDHDDDEHLPTDAEAQAVADAIGYKDWPTWEAGMMGGNALDRSMSAPEAGGRAPKKGPTDVTTPENREGTAYFDGSERGESPEEVRSPGPMLKSPELRDLDSPEISESEEEDEEEEDEDEDRRGRTKKPAATAEAEENDEDEEDDYDSLPKGRFAGVVDELGARKQGKNIYIPRSRREAEAAESSEDEDG